MSSFEEVYFSDDEEIDVYDVNKINKTQCTLTELARLTLATERVEKALAYVNGLEYLKLNRKFSSHQKKLHQYRLAVAKLELQKAYDKLSYVKKIIGCNIAYRNNCNLYLSDSD